MSQYIDATHGRPGPEVPSQGVFGAPTLLAQPGEVANDPHLTLDEKRALLAWWLSDAHAVPNAPVWRQLDDGAFVRAEDVLEALRSLDDPHGGNRQEPTGSPRPSPFDRRRRSVRWIDGALRRKRRDDDDDDDPPPTPVTSRLPPHPPLPSRGTGAGAGRACRLGQVAFLSVSRAMR